MWMTDYIREIKRQFRDVYHMKPSRTVGDEPCFNHIPDGEYPMKIEGKTDYVRVTDNSISCCNHKAKKAMSK